MKIFVDHTHGFGKMRDQAYIYAPIGAVVNADEQEYALENGWCPLEKNIWFQTRSTRIDIAQYKPDNKTLKKASKVKAYYDIGIQEYKKTIFEEIYKKYISHKKFGNVDFSFYDIVRYSNGHAYYTYNNKIVGFCFFKIIGKNLFAIEFAWDYVNPELGLGKTNIHSLCNYAKMRRYKYLYLSSGYESCSIYKSTFKGFEWWTGLEWKNDVEHFKKLCYSDDTVQIKFDWEKL